jgi:hypothetical protein
MSTANSPYFPETPSARVPLGGLNDGLRDVRKKLLSPARSQGLHGSLMVKRFCFPTKVLREGQDVGSASGWRSAIFRPSLVLVFQRADNSLGPLGRDATILRNA